MTGKAPVSQLSALISRAGIDQLLEVSCLPDGTEEITASAVVAAIEDWVIKSRIHGMAFDTTSSNTVHALFWWRSWTNVCYLLPAGIIFLNVCSLTLVPSSGPDIRMFKCFQSSWP